MGQRRLLIEVVGVARARRWCEWLRDIVGRLVRLCDNLCLSLCVGSGNCEKSEMVGDASSIE